MITVVCGLPGSGKSYYLAARGLSACRRGRAVYSNVPLAGAFQLEVDWLQEKLFPRDSLLLIDEAGLAFNSREWAAFPKETYLLMAQHRKAGLDLLMAVQHPKRLDKALRELAGVFLWASPHWFFWFRYESYMSMEDFGMVRPLGRKWLLKRRKVLRAYDTMFMHEALHRAMAPQIRWPAVSGSSRRPVGAVVRGWLGAVVSWVRKVLGRCGR